MRLSRFRWVIPLLFVAACAIPEPPPGGPEDTTPPSVVATIPVADSAGVDPTSEIRLQFSEKMTRRNVERNLTFLPDAPLGKVGWDGTTIIVKPRDPFHPDTTYLVELRPGISDRHRVRTTDTYRFAFATSAAIDSGKISGEIVFRRKPAQNARVRLWTVPADSGFAPEASRPQREAAANEDGAYQLGYLSTDEVGYIVWAFEDGNGNGAYDPDSEAGAQLPDTVYLTSERVQALAQNITIVDPREPGAVTGIVMNYTEFDSVFVTIAMREIADTLAKEYIKPAGADGRFSLAPLQGSYILSAFIDMQRDSLCGTFPCPGDSTTDCQEPCYTHPDTIVIAPGDKVQLEDIILGEPPEEEADPSETDEEDSE